MSNIDLSPLGTLPNVALKKITLSYSEEEDRLQVLAAGDDGHAYSFWLTRKLLKRLVDHLAQKFSPSSNMPDHQRVVDGLMLETKAQSAVQQYDTQSPPVSSVKVKETLLITSVDIAVSDERVSLGWRSSATQFLLQMSQDEFFQWLFAVRSTISGADWAMAWPDWIENADVSHSLERRPSKKVH